MGRDVALKILPEAFVNDPERLARFQREAKLLASLNHPNIAQIYELEESGDSPALVLEYVEGPTLQELISPSPGLRPSSPPPGARITGKPLPLEEALPIAKQIAEALEAAHEQGIIHRDLKPANVKVKDDGTVKVLDFGLAKALEPELSDLEAANSPTMTMTAAATKMGVIMGTAAYMAPEQAAGKRVDRRADIWAFGVVLWEMLTGKQLFTGESISHVLAAVLTTDPDWTALPSDTPSAVRRLLRRCLERNPRERLQHVGDARIEIKEARGEAVADEAPGAAVAESSFWQRPVAALLAGLLLVAVTTAVTRIAFRGAGDDGPIPSQRYHLTMPLLAAAPMALDVRRPSVAISPDGDHAVYVGIQDGQRARFLREAGEAQARVVPGTAYASGPFFSADGQSVGFIVDREMKQVSVNGGRPETISRIHPVTRGATWGLDDRIVFGSNINGGLQQVSAAGDELPPNFFSEDPPTEGVRLPSPMIQELTREDPAAGEFSHRWPDLLPGGRAVLFAIGTGGSFDDANIAVLSLDTGAVNVLVRGGTGARYSATGHIVYARSGMLLAAPFDVERLEMTS